jgi:membrane-associated phospholipid phosphatase
VSLTSNDRLALRSDWKQVATTGAILAGVFVGLALVLAALGLGLIGRHGGGAIQGWDDTVGRWFLHHRTHLVRVSKVIAKVLDAGPLGLIVVVITLALLARRQGTRALIPLGGYLGGEALVYVTRIYMHRPRPATAVYPAPGAIAGVHETSYSFPSGHATGAAATLMCLAGLAAMTWRIWWPWLIGILAALAVGGSRLVLGVHWFSDVAFGLIVALPLALVVTSTLANLEWPFPWLRPHPRGRGAERPEAA